MSAITRATSNRSSALWSITRGSGFFSRLRQRRRWWAAGHPLRGDGRLGEVVAERAEPGAFAQGRNPRQGPARARARAAARRGAQGGRLRYEHDGPSAASLRREGATESEWRFLDIFSTVEARRGTRMQLYIVRHGPAGEASEWAGPDRERPLTAKGREVVSRVEERLDELGVRSRGDRLEPVRARRETADILAAQLSEMTAEVGRSARGGVRDRGPDEPARRLLRRPRFS